VAIGNNVHVIVVIFPVQSWIAVSECMKWQPDTCRTIQKVHSIHDAESISLDRESFLLCSKNTQEITTTALFQQNQLKLAAIMVEMIRH
jgi:hypothetical protein